MASVQDYKSIQANAAMNMASHAWHIVRLSAAGTTMIASLDTSSQIAGVLAGAVNSGDRATIAYDGRAKVVAGAAVTANAFITTNSSGRAVAAGSGDMVIGRALEAAGADGEVVSCLLVSPFRWSGAV